MKVWKPMSNTDRAATPIVALYWLAVFGGLGLYTYHAPGSTSSLWIGTLIGTLMGQICALLNLRTWFVISSIFGLLVLCVPLFAFGAQDDRFWMALMPAILCGYWALGERAALIAFWFPTVIWMLSILDRQAALVPDGVGDVLLVAVVALFVVFLRVRESRRVTLWKTVASEPVATHAGVEITRERPGSWVARGAWTLTAAAIACAMTAWIAPRLWRLEELDGKTKKTGDGAGGVAYGDALPCCSFDDAGEALRVNEYFDLGRGTPIPELGVDCRVCQPSSPDWDRWQDSYDDPGEGDGTYYDGPTTIAPTGRGEAYAGAYATGGGGGVYGGATVGGQGTNTGYGDGGYGGYARAPSAYADHGTAGTGNGLATTNGTGATGTAPTGAMNPTATQPVAPLTSSDPATATNQPTTPANVPAPAAAPTNPQTAPTPSSAPTADPYANMVPSPPAMTDGRAPANHAAYAPPPRAPGRAGFMLGALVIAVMSFQLVALALRPIRRAVTLRHLRRPFWDETIDQRISNSWQLALVGLRDAGWRATSTEAPRQFAKRTGIAGLEECATIVERARHGVGLDAGDLATMTAQAERAYRSARASLGVVPRVLATLRRPLA